MSDIIISVNDGSVLSDSSWCSSDGNVSVMAVSHDGSVP